MTIGIRKGDALSPILFYIVFKFVTYYNNNMLSKTKRACVRQFPNKQEIEFLLELNLKTILVLKILKLWS